MSFCKVNQKKLCGKNNCDICVPRSFQSNLKSKFWSDKNLEKPYQVLATTNKKILFTCEKCFHIFESQLYNITVKNTWCSFCANLKLCTDDNCQTCISKSFSSHPKSIYFSANNTKNPRCIFKGTQDKYLFNCDKCHHEFNISINSITTNNHWCNYCSNKYLCGSDSCQFCLVKSFASHSKSIYFSENNKKKPLEIFKGTHDKYLFNCDKCHHEFSISINSITTSNHWCNYCSNKILCLSENCVVCFNKSFSSHPKSIYFSKKNSIIPREIFKSTCFKYIFHCNICDHDFKTSPNNIVCKNNWCPYCSNSKLCESQDCIRCFENSFENCSTSKNWSNKNLEKPRNIFRFSGKKYYLNCKECNHECYITLNGLEENRNWCIYCVNQKLCSDLKCNYCFTNSFASNENSIYWSKKNGNVTPRDVFKATPNKFYFDCKECKHEIFISLSAVHSNRWCSYCTNQILCSSENCILCFSKSFASHPKVIYFSDKNEELPRNLFKGTNAKFLFNCNTCNHVFLLSLDKLTGLNRWCSFCAHKNLCSNNNCNMCFENSFASVESSKYFSEINNINTRDLFKKSQKKYFFDCYICNIKFEMCLNNVSIGNWCNCIINKTEHKFFRFLQEYNFKVKKEKTFDWSSKKRYDFYLEDLKLLVEIDGLQHKFQVSNWISPELNIINDALKDKMAIDNGLHLIRFCQDSIWLDKMDWKKMFLDSIEKIKDKDPTLMSFGKLYEL